MDDLISDQQQTLENTLLSLKEAVEWQLKLILAAIKRIATEDYGFCLACGENIGFLRLQAQAYAPYCLPCQAERVRPRHSPFQPQPLQFGHD